MSQQQQTNEGQVLASLQQACQKADTAAVAALLSDGVDVNLRMFYGQTPLIWVADYAHEHPRAAELLQFLLQAGADPNLQDRSGMTALHRSACRASAVMAAVLMPVTDLSLKTTEGDCALIRAADAGSPLICRSLLLHGSDVNSHDNNGHSVLSWAAKVGNEEVVEILLQFGGDPATGIWPASGKLSVEDVLRIRDRWWRTPWTIRQAAFFNTRCRGCPKLFALLLWCDQQTVAKRALPTEVWWVIMSFFQVCDFEEFEKPGSTTQPLKDVSESS
eukprot:m.119298 g.119298  ORF g.119298 m.119298 type:complete len:275 (+) comp23168_c0_seq1:243-1067(+)